METGLKGKSVIVTGAASHIGRGIALAFAREGAKVAIADIDEVNGQKVAEKATELGAEAAVCVKTDVTRKEDIQALVRTVLNRFGSLDVLVNNVGVWNTVVFMEEPDEAVDRQIEVNLKSVINCTKAVLPHMIEARNGRIINIGSEAGRAGDPDRVVYAATKGGIVSFTRALARAVGKYDITVNCVCPHAIRPEVEDGVVLPAAFSRELQRAIGQSGAEDVTSSVSHGHVHGHALGWLGKPRHIAASVLFFASVDAAYITGQTLNVNGGDTMN